MLIGDDNPNSDHPFQEKENHLTSAPYSVVAYQME